MSADTTENNNDTTENFFIQENITDLFNLFQVFADTKENNPFILFKSDGSGMILKENKDNFYFESVEDGIEKLKELLS